MSILRLEHVFFQRQGRKILHDISWQVESGRHWALLGANGAGKTTLLKILTGYEWPTSGSVHVLSRRFGNCDITELRKHIGWVSSSLEVNLPPSENAMDIVLSGLEASLGLYRDFTIEEHQLAHRALAAMSMASLAEQTFGTLSQGEQQRVLIARALVCGPAVLILDEPCIGLDPAARFAFLADVQRLARQPDGPALIYVTHHIEEIGPWITDVLVLCKGIIVAAGPKEDVLTSEIMNLAFSGNEQKRTQSPRLRFSVRNAGSNYRLDIETRPEL